MPKEDASTWLSAYIRRMLTNCWSGCSLLKFRDGDETTYDEYRDCAGKLVLAKGGSLAFLGKVTKVS